jgi:hypothetical protein
MFSVTISKCLLLHPISHILRIFWNLLRFEITGFKIIFWISSHASLETMICNMGDVLWMLWNVHMERSYGTFIWNGSVPWQGLLASQDSGSRILFYCFASLGEHHVYKNVASFAGSIGTEPVKPWHTISWRVNYPSRPCYLGAELNFPTTQDFMWNLP